MFVIVLSYLPAVELLYALQLLATPGQITDVVKGGFSAWSSYTRTGTDSINVLPAGI